jgi:hypothetical protein
MKIGRVNLVYFSPTNTTRKILEGISQGMQAESVRHFDLTLPEAEREAAESFSSEPTMLPLSGGV